ncbi:MAG: PASTA domain-containing protein, partial [Clostridiales bacterium]|nr:PASTA domain-containing protein [Clostridiales bacterium]
ISVLQLITAVSAVANGGKLLTPYLVESITDAQGNTVYSHETQVRREVISEKTSKTICEILAGGVSGEGGAKNAYAAGYRIGGKTGTSEKRDEDTGDLIVSFLGVAPANDPKVVVLLGYDSPTPSSPGSNYTAGGTYISGGNMAAVMAGELISDILEYMGVEKEYSKEELSSVDTLVPKVTEISLGEAQRLLKNSGLAWRIVGDGDMVTDQIPAQGTSIPKNSQVVLYLGEERPSDLITVPELLGRSPDAVQTMLQSAGLYLRATGNVDYYSSKTLAIDQSVAGGTQVEPGTVVEVRFIDSQIKDY